MTACLQRDPFLEKVHKVPQDPLRKAAVLGPTVATMSASCIVKDKVMGVTYMDTVYSGPISAGVSGSQWPQAGGLNSGAHHRGHHGPCVMN